MRSNGATALFEHGGGYVLEISIESHFSFDFRNYLLIISHEESDCNDFHRIPIMNPPIFLAASSCICVVTWVYVSRVNPAE